MFQALFDSTTVPLLQKVAAFTERRHDILAGNIANISTPDYKTRDLPVAEFQKSLADAISRRELPSRPAGDNWSFAAAATQPSAGSLSRPELYQAIDAVPNGVTFQDGNNRNIETEVMEMTKNQLLQTVAIELMNSQLGRLQAVISERP